MKRKNRRRVLAIGLDATEPAFIRSLIEAGEMPVLARLLNEGAWMRVASPASIGSGTVWPTFFTGTEPAEHCVYSEWRWQPETMSLARYDDRSLKPFWKRLSDEGVTVGILDVPFAPVVGLTEGFEIAEWGAHDAFEGRMRFAPERLSELLTKEVAPHPFSSGVEGVTDPFELEGLRRLSAACLEGVKLRGELAARLIRETETQLSIIVFPEIHHAAHKLWHTVAPDHGLYAKDELRNALEVEPRLPDILREIDCQVGRLMETVGDEAVVMVFSLHGMRPARGLPDFLGPLLCAKGQARLSDWGTQSWAERGVSLFAKVKRHAPSGLKQIYHRRLPQGMTNRLAQPTMIPAYDWSRTRAFALPSDQHGWIRINLKGREAKGCVPVESYRETCLEIEEMLRKLVTEDGSSLVRQVIHTAESAEDYLSRRIPDMVVHWHDAAFELPMRMNGLLLEAHTAAAGLTGQHAPDGFLLLKGKKDLTPDVINATEIQRVINESLADD